MKNYTKIRWSKFGLDAYKKTGDDMKALGFCLLREIKDGDTQSVLTFWISPNIPLAEWTSSVVGRKAPNAAQNA